MDNLQTQESQQVTIFPRLRFQGTTSLGVRQESDDFLIHLEARIVGECDPDAGGDLPAQIHLGDLDAVLIRLSRAYEENFDPLNIFDESQELLDLASALFKPPFREFVDEIEETFPEAWPYEDILYIRNLTVQPIARGQRLGASALHRFMTDWESGCSLVVIPSRPLQFAPGIRQDPDWKLLALDELPADRAEAQARLENHYRGLGFQTIGEIPWMLFCPSYRQAPLQELALANTILLNRCDLAKDPGA